MSSVNAQDQVFSDYLAAFNRANPHHKKAPSLSYVKGWVHTEWFGYKQKVRLSTIKEWTERLNKRMDKHADQYAPNPPSGG